MADKEPTKFMKIRDSWPIENISNKLFSVSKTEFCQVPEGLIPDPNIFEIFNTPQEALAATQKIEPIKTREPDSRKPGDGITTRASMPKLTGEKPVIKETKGSDEDMAEFHGFREMMDVKTGNKAFMLATKDIPRFLNREQVDIIKDIQKLDLGTIERITAAEKMSRRRPDVILAISNRSAVLQNAELKAEPPESEDKLEETITPQVTNFETKKIESVAKAVEERTVKTDGKKTSKVGPKSDLNRLLNIKGIGPKTVADIKRICSTVEELRTMLNGDSVPLRDDIVAQLKEVLL